MRHTNLKGYGLVSYYRAPLLPVKAMVIRRKIYVKNNPSQRLLRHEMIHVLQQQELGWWKFLWRYIMLWFKHGYESHPMEEDAREWEFDEDFDTERPYKNWRKYL